MVVIKKLLLIQYLKGIHNLEILGCNKIITDNALENLRGIHIVNKDF